MNRHSPRRTSAASQRGAVWTGIALLLLPLPAVVCAGERRDDLLVEGFTEPYRTIDIAAADSGIVEQIHVAEGDLVRTGQLLVTLDRELHHAQLAIARQAASAQGKTASAEAELQLRRVRLAKLEQLHSRGFARAEEVERAQADVRLAEAELLTVQEELQIRKLEFERTQVQLARRSIHSRLNGVVTKIHKETGEFVAGNDLAVVTVMQLDPLRLSFSVPRDHAVRLQERTAVPIRFAGSAREAKARVEFISPVTDAESNTVVVRLVLDNPGGHFRAGDRCELDLRVLASDLAQSAGRREERRKTAEGRELSHVIKSSDP